MLLPFGQKVRERREELVLQQAELAEKVGVTASYVSLIENGRRPAPSDDVVRRLEGALKMESGELIRLAHLERTPTDIRREMDLDRLYREGILHKRAGAVEPTVPVVELLRRIPLINKSEQSFSTAFSAESRGAIPLINKVAAGYPSDFTDKGYPVGVADEYVSIPDIDDPNAFAISVVGDSMEPRFNEGDVLIISPAETVASGDVCFVRIDRDGESVSTIKQVWFDDEESVRLESINRRYASQIVAREGIGGMYRAVRRLEKL